MRVQLEDVGVVKTEMMVNKDGSGEDDDSRDISEVESRG